MSWLTAVPNGVVLAVRAVPRAARSELAGEAGGALRVRLQAPPVEGKANKALVRFLAEALGVPPRRVALLAGDRSRAKRVFVEGVSEAAARAKLSPAP